MIKLALHGFSYLTDAQISTMRNHYRRESLEELLKSGGKEYELVSVEDLTQVVQRFFFLLQIQLFTFTHSTL